MPGLVPGIHVFGSTGKKDVDGRDKPGHDEDYSVKLLPKPQIAILPGIIQLLCRKAVAAA
jgi:hypothetical protein